MGRSDYVLGRTQSETPHYVDPSTEQLLSIWFFVGVLTLACGLIIFGQGIYEFWHPGTTVLAELHPAFWRGMVMVLFGGFYIINFRPGKGKFAPKIRSEFKDADNDSSLKLRLLYPLEYCGGTDEPN